MSDTIRPRRLNRYVGMALAGLTTAAVVLVPASPAAAHHGWDGFHTDQLVYIAGAVSSEGSWGQPHSYFNVTLDGELPADTPELTIPDELQNPEDSIRVESAIAYAGPQDELEVIIAPPAYSGRWGLDRPLNIEERFQGVGYINRTDDALFRPVAFWYGDDDVPVNQVLGNTLPVRAPLPGTPETSAGQPSAPTTSTAQDPFKTPALEANADNSTPGGGPGAWVVWTVFGVVVIAAAGGGFLYLRRRTRQN